MTLDAGAFEELRNRLQALERENARLAEELRLAQGGPEAARLLSEREEKYRILFDHVPDGVLLVSADEEHDFGRIVEANERSARMHGYTLEELKRLNVDELLASSPQLESFEARIWRLQPGETVTEELLHHRRDGSSFPVEAIGTLLELDGRQYVLAFARDITQRKAAEEALLRSQRAESIGILAGGIAHDFNNLLTAIMGQTFIVFERLAKEDESRTNLRRALDAAEKASVLTQQMLAYTGRAKVTAQPLSVNRLIEENRSFLEASIPKNVRFELDLAEGLPSVTGDLGQLQQVIMNLVMNGAEAIGPAAGCIQLKTALARMDEAEARTWSLAGDLLPAGDYVLVEVSDDGCGMDDQTRGQVFDPFFSTKEKGHGLGLAAVLGIVKGHRGGLRMHTELAEGTSFWLALPAGEHLATGPVEPPPLDGPHFGGRRVLVIDDESYMLEVVNDILAMNGHTAILASSGEAGIELFKEEGPGGIDMVLLDLTMPGLSGQETLRVLREIDPGVRVVLSSGFAEEEALGRLQELEIMGFLQKPYPARELLRILDELPERE